MSLRKVLRIEDEVSGEHSTGISQPASSASQADTPALQGFSDAPSGAALPPTGN